jgi:hypothetical protein
VTTHIPEKLVMRRSVLRLISVLDLVVDEVSVWRESVHACTVLQVIRVKSTHLRLVRTIVRDLIMAFA